MKHRTPLFACTVTIALALAATAKDEPHPITDIWLDVDPSNLIIDDAIAMIQAFHSPELRVRGVSVQFGNGTIQEALPIAREVVDRFGPPLMEAHRGAADSDELGRLSPAVDALAASLRKGPMTIVALGPMTNVATLLRTFPELHGRIDRIVLVAGRRPGQRFTADGKTVLCDCNFDADVPAMREVLASRIPLVLAGWEVARDTSLTREDLTQLATAGPTGRWIADAAQPRIERDASRTGIAALNPFDSMAVAWVTRPNLFTSAPVRAWIESRPNDENDATGDKPYLLVERDTDAKREILYLLAPQDGLKPFLLQRLEPGSDRMRPTADAPLDVWLDVDPANGIGEVDDGLMMIQAFHSPELRVRGVSVVYGNTELDRALPIAREIVDRFGPDRLTVHSGAASKAQLGESTPAVRALAASLREQPLTILAVGPVTNIATLIQLHPELKERIERIVMVAARRDHQRFFVSKRTLTDFNFEHDPAAMQVILDTEIPLMFAPWEVSSHVWITRADLAALRRSGPPGAWIAETCASWIDRWEKNIGPWGFNPFDTLAAGALTHPDLIETRRVDAWIEQRIDDTAPLEQRRAGQTKPYLLVKPAEQTGREILYATRPAPAFKHALLRRLAGPPGTSAASDLPSRATADHSTFASLLRRFVDEHGMVDYRQLATQSSTLDGYLATLAETDLESLTRDQQLALLINAYNAFTLKLILDHYPVDSIMHVPDDERWRAKRWRLGGRKVSLDEIEHQWIRPRFADPRIHFALVCAAKGCPPLRREAYTALRLDEQLADQTRYVHTHDRWLQFDPAAGELKLTKLYDWYGDDFLPAATSVLDYAARYAPALREALRAGKKPQVRWLDYDWSLNDQGD